MIRFDRIFPNPIILFLIEVGNSNTGKNFANFELIRTDLIHHTPIKVSLDTRCSNTLPKIKVSSYDVYRVNFILVKS